MSSKYRIAAISLTDISVLDSNVLISQIVCWSISSSDSSCNHGYYAHHGFEMVAEFKSDEWKTDSDDYLTYIYRKSF